MAVGLGRGCAEDVLGPRIQIPEVNRVNRAVGRCVFTGCLRLLGSGLGLGLGLGFRVRIRG